MTFPVIESTATTLGSARTTPSPLDQTRQFDVPRSIPSLFEDKRGRRMGAFYCHKNASASSRFFLSTPIITNHIKELQRLRGYRRLRRFGRSLFLMEADQAVELGFKRIIQAIYLM